MVIYIKMCSFHTLQEREVNKQLHSELQQLKKSGELNLVIRCGWIIPKQFFSRAAPHSMDIVTPWSKHNTTKRLSNQRIMLLFNQRIMQLFQKLSSLDITCLGIIFKSNKTWLLISHSDFENLMRASGCYSLFTKAQFTS